MVMMQKVHEYVSENEPVSSKQLEEEFGDDVLYFVKRLENEGYLRLSFSLNYKTKKKFP